MRNEVMWSIRDNRSLNYKHKAFLFVVESRGEQFTAWENAAADMGMKKDMYFETRNELQELGLLSIRKDKTGPTHYTVNAEALEALTHSDMPNEDSDMPNSHSDIQNGHSEIPEQKKNTKKNKKVNMKKNTDESLIREEAGTQSSLNQELPAVPLSTSEQVRHSEIENGAWSFLKRDDTYAAARAALAARPVVKKPQLVGEPW